MYCLRLFIVVLQELQCLLDCLHVCMIRVTKFFTLHLLVSEIANVGCLLFFYNNYIVYYNVYCYDCGKVCVHQVSS